MAVKRSHSGSRILSVLEAIASHQPIGVTALARLLDEDKSAIQRALATLADEGWIRTLSEPPTRWELTAHILAVAYAAHGSNDLRRRARPVLERLRDDSGETVLLALPDGKRFVIADIIESRQALRMVPDVGDVIEPRGTATGRAVLAFMSHEQQAALLGSPPEPELLEKLGPIRACGYAISEGEVNPLATIIAAPIIGFDEAPLAAILVCGPRERVSPALHTMIAEKLVRAARELSSAKSTFR